MVSVLAFDPSTRSTGWSWWCRGSLQEAGAVRGKNTQDMLRKLKQDPALASVVNFCVDVDLMVIERPKIYDPTRSKASANKIAQVMLIAGACTMAAGYVKLLMPFPEDWKGSVPKHVTERRAKKKLEKQWPRIQTILDDQLKTSRDDVADAIALGLWAHERENLYLQ